MIDLRKAQGYPKQWEVPSRNNAESNQPGGLMDPKPTLMGSYARAIRKYEAPEGYSVESDMDYKKSNQPYERI